MSEKVNCPFCGNIVEADLYRCPKCESLFKEPELPYIKFKEFRIFIALSVLTGGLFYTVGGVIYALKCPIFNLKHKWFGSHEIFHVFVMLGSACHFIFMYHYVL